ncbi:unnamed protein product [Protopolystoma xenopodis]|uniref:Uncharacterized protein n=1 Tax=Protopolystoma xenopodis TaxID=117903 RepID=A0A3S5A1K6_9PLAT|nr:unnamed protein product [Protopolystoma xenopodis]
MIALPSSSSTAVMTAQCCSHVKARRVGQLVEDEPAKGELASSDRILTTLSRTGRFESSSDHMHGPHVRLKGVIPLASTRPNQQVHTDRLTGGDQRKLRLRQSGTHLPKYVSLSVIV